MFRVSGAAFARPAAPERIKAPLAPESKHPSTDALHDLDSVSMTGSLNCVEFRGVVAEEPPLDSVAKVAPLPDLLDGTLACLPVRHVCRDHDPVLSDKIDDLWHELLLCLASEVNVALAHVLARSPLGHRPMVGGLGVKVVIHSLDQVGDPIDASFQKGDFEPRKTI